MSDARNLGETALRGVRGQPSAEIARVGCAKPGRNCVTRCAWSTLCGPGGAFHRNNSATESISMESPLLQGLSQLEPF